MSSEAGALSRAPGLVAAASPVAYGCRPGTEPVAYLRSAGAEPFARGCRAGARAEPFPDGCRAGARPEPIAEGRSQLTVISVGDAPWPGSGDWSQL